MFGKTDLKLGYWKVAIHAGDIEKTAFKMRWELYEYVVMPCSITNAPAHFMGMMNDLLGEYLDRFVLIFLDDILVYSCNLKEHDEHLRKVLGKRQEHQLFAKASRCAFVNSPIKFLGQQSTFCGMTLMEAKLRAIRDWARPSNVHNIWSFLGFANYY